MQTCVAALRLPGRMSVERVAGCWWTGWPDGVECAAVDVWDALGFLTNTLNSTDVLNGGPGVDTLNVVLGGHERITPTLKGIEHVRINFYDGPTLDLSGSTGVNLVTLQSSVMGSGVGTIDASAAVTSGIRFDLLALTSSSKQINVIGSAAADTFLLSHQAVVTGGGGNDMFIVRPALNGSTITDISKGDTLIFTTGARSFLSNKLEVAGATYVYDYYSAALDPNVRGGAETGVVSWFQAQGDTYLMHDNSVGASYNIEQDSVIKLQGLVDLSTAVFNPDNGVLTI